MVRIFVKISILTLLVLAWSGPSSASEQNVNSNPCNISETDAAGLNGNLSVDIHAPHNFMDTAARILKEEKFAELDCLADRERDGVTAEGVQYIAGSCSARNGRLAAPHNVFPARTGEIDARVHQLGAAL